MQDSNSPSQDLARLQRRVAQFGVVVAVLFLWLTGMQLRGSHSQGLRVVDEISHHAMYTKSLHSFGEGGAALDSEALSALMQRLRNSHDELVGEDAVRLVKASSDEEGPGLLESAGHLMSSMEAWTESVATGEPTVRPDAAIATYTGLLWQVNAQLIKEQVSASSARSMKIGLMTLLIGVVCFAGWRFGVSPLRQAIAEAANRPATAVDDTTRALLEGLDAVSWELDWSTGQFNYISPQVTRFGHAAESWTNRDFWQAQIHEEDRERVVAERSSATERGEGHVLVYRMLTPDGSVLWIEDIVAVKSVPDGPTLLRGVFHDITESKAREAELLRNTDQLQQTSDELQRTATDLQRTSAEIDVERERLQKALGAGGVGTWQWNPATDEVTYDERLASILGCELEDLEPTLEGWSSRVHPDDLDAASTAVQEHIEGTTETYERTYRMRHQDGSWRWILELGQVVDRDNEDNPLRVAGSQQDVTELKDREAELERQAAELERERDRKELALAGGNTGLWDWNPVSGELVFDERSTGMLGRDVEEVEATFTGWKSLMHPEDHSVVEQALEAHFEGITPTYQATYRMQHVDGSWRWVMSLGSVVTRDERGQPLRVVGTHLDVTASKEHELELMRLRDEARAESEAKSGFLENIGRELRSPLSSILGYAEWLEEDMTAGNSNAASMEKLSVVKSAGKHLHSLLEGATKFDKDTAEVQRTNLPELLQGVMQVMEPRASSKDLAFRVLLGGPIPCEIETDPMRLRQILINIIDNAVEFTSEGRIGIRITASERLIVEVADTGSGMSEDQVARLFNAEPPAGGASLGLASARRLATQMGGCVRLVRTAEGSGSLIAIDLPLTELPGTERTDSIEDEREKTLTASRDASARLRGRVLLVHDNDVQQRLLAAILTDVQLEVVQTSDASAAFGLQQLASAEGAPFDLVLTAIEDAAGEGLSLARQLRESGQELPIIALTASGSSEDRERALQSGCSDCLYMPIERDALVAACAQQLQRRERKAA